MRLFVLFQIILGSTFQLIEARSFDDQGKMEDLFQAMEKLNQTKMLLSKFQKELMMVQE